MPKMEYDLPAGVTLEILDDDAYRADRRDSAFYTWWDTNKIASLTYKDREYSIYSIGEMRIHYKDQVIRYCDDLINAGITDDSKLYKIEEEGGEWVNNSWFEVYDELRQEFTEIVYHDVKEVIEDVAKLIMEENVDA